MCSVLTIYLPTFLETYLPTSLPMYLPMSITDLQPYPPTYELMYRYLLPVSLLTCDLLTHVPIHYSHITAYTPISGLFRRVTCLPMFRYLRTYALCSLSPYLSVPPYPSACLPLPSLSWSLVYSRVVAHSLCLCLPTQPRTYRGHLPTRQCPHLPLPANQLTHFEVQ